MLFVMTDETDDSKVWQIVKKSVKPLKKPNIYIASKNKKTINKKPAKLSADLKEISFKNFGKSTIKPKTTISLQEKDIGNTDNLNKSHAKKLRTKNLNVDMTLDLHGHTQAQAYTAISDFMYKAHNNNCSTIKIITGKGKGVLQTQVPLWLSDYPNILSIVHAPQNQGGSGVLLIALKRKKA